MADWPVHWANNPDDPSSSSTINGVVGFLTQSLQPKFWF